MAYVFDGSNKIIYLTSGTTVLDVRDVYSKWKEWIQVSGSVYQQAFSIVGGEPVDPIQGIYVTSYIFLENNWKIRPQEANHKLNVRNGVLVTSDGSDPFVQPIGSYNVLIQYSQPVKSETVSTGGGGGGGIVTSIQPEALSQIIASGNAAGWDQGGGSSSGVIEISGFAGTNLQLQLKYTDINKQFNFVYESMVNGSGYTQYAPHIEVMRLSDNYFLSGSAWVDTAFKNEMLPLDPINFAGLYYLPHQAVSNVDSYIVKYSISGYNFTEHEQWMIEDKSANTTIDTVSGIVKSIADVTNKFKFTGDDVWCTLNGEKVVVCKNEDKYGYTILTSNLEELLTSGGTPAAEVLVQNSGGSRMFNRKSNNKLFAGRASAGSSASMNEIDLRKEFRDTLYGTGNKPQRGYWVAYRRFDKTKKSDFYDEVYNSGINGPTFQYTDELVITRQDPVFSPEMAEASMPAGLLKGGQSIFYFEYSFMPSPDDQIFEIGWNDHQLKPSNTILNGRYLKKYNIKEVFPYRLDGGRVEYYMVYANTDLVNY